MSLHDAYARRTPPELLFPNQAAAARLSAAVAREASEQGIDPSSRAAFPSLPSVGAYLSEVRGPDAPAEAVHDYAALLFHAFHFADAGRPLYLVTTEGSRRLVTGLDPANELEPPDEAGYLQLPQHLFWLGGGDSVPAESVDGICWTRGTDGLLHLLAATGMRGDRPGLGVVQVPEAPWADAPRWLEAAVRPSGDDFANVLPGGELEDLYAFSAAGEILKLFARFCIFVSTGSARVTRHEPEAVAEAQHPVPSGLPYYRVEPNA